MAHNRVQRCASGLGLRIRLEDNILGRHPEGSLNSILPLRLDGTDEATNRRSLLTHAIDLTRADFVQFSILSVSFHASRWQESARINRLLSLTIPRRSTNEKSKKTCLGCFERSLSRLLNELLNRFLNYSLRW